jgi:hypothetical protein
MFSHVFPFKVLDGQRNPSHPGIPSSLLGFSPTARQLVMRQNKKSNRKRWIFTIRPMVIRILSWNIPSQSAIKLQRQSAPIYLMIYM